jgi:branched-subunit amino acid aminotransferase/4-amino-4-deoxychorismate lyase
MVKFLLKKSYQQKNLKEVPFKDLWNKNGVFTTMWIYGRPPKILFFRSHINNLIKSLKIFKILKKDTKKNILNLIKKNIDKKINYNHLLRVALDKKFISVSLRKKIKIKKEFTLKLVNHKRFKPEFKNLKYKIILKHLSKLDSSKNDIALCVNGKLLETGTSNLLFISNKKIYSPISKFYRGINLTFFQKKIKINKKNIFIKNIEDFDEIILIGSGKSVTSVHSISELKWKRKSQIVYTKLKKIFDIESKKKIYLYN